MLINTKHIVLFDDAAADFPRIADMVDNDGAVLILKDGKPAYAVVAFDDVQEADRAEGLSGEGAAPAGEPKASTGAKAGKDDTGCCRERGKAGKGEGRSDAKFEGKGKGHHHHHAHDEWDVGEPWFGGPGFGGHG
ncbi:MAG: hypothetical protein FWG25_07485, partial [Promicromonosporaceae bacterium]|nr:hypothetical protein [Promicromonosporaceae bacterium]